MIPPKLTISAILLDHHSHTPNGEEHHTFPQYRISRLTKSTKDLLILTRRAVPDLPRLCMGRQTYTAEVEPCFAAELVSSVIIAHDHVVVIWLSARAA